MNRREMLNATVGAIAGASAGSLIASENKSDDYFSIPIDDRLSGRIVFPNLKDSEWGYIYISAARICHCKADDGLCYFSLSQMFEFDLVYNDKDKIMLGAQDCMVAISKVENYFYIKPASPSISFNNSFTGLTPLSPAILAFNIAYPLNQVENNIYKIPCNWKDCQSNILVRRNVEHLRKLKSINENIMEEFGITPNYGQGYHSYHEQLKLALLEN